MKNKNLIWSGFLLMIVCVSIAISCNKKFDQPPAYSAATDTMVGKVNTTIKALKAMHSSGGLESITTNVVISGIVSANDKSGNLYKQICIQDSTGGLTVLLSGSNLYVDYPVGRRVYIKCKGLYLSDYAKLVQLGSLDNSIPTNLALTSIPSTLISNYVVPADFGNTVTPKVVTIAQINAAAVTANANPAADTLQSTLIQLNGVQFASTDTSFVWADTSASKSAVSRNITDCPGSKTVAYTSGYATFAGLKVPSGKGTITAVYVPYKATSELLIRDTSDVQLKGPRCGSAVTMYNGTTAFSNISGTGTVAPTGWLNIGEVGNKLYYGYVSGSLKYATITSYNVGQPVVTSWLISPAITVTLPTGTTSPYYTFYSINGYDNGATLKVLASTNYTGNNTPSTATWTQLALAPGGSTSSYSTAALVTVDLSAYIGKTVYLAFRYDGTAAVNTTYEVRDPNVVAY